MSFTSKKVQPQSYNIGLIKGATLFFLGMSCVLFMARAFEIEPSMPNTVQFIKSIFLTQDGSNATTTKIALDGFMGNGNFSGTVTATNIKANTITGTTICLVADTSTNKCRTSWPTGGTASVGGGESIWSTGANGVAYYTSGNVGIGTGTPAYLLDVHGTGHFQELCLGTDCRTIWPTGGTASVGGGESIWSTGANGIAYYTSGNVGIGTTGPTEQLQIGNYAWIGRNITPLYGTGGTFLRLSGTRPNVANPPSENGTRSYAPNIQLNYGVETLGLGYSYYNWKIDGGSSFGLKYSPGSQTRTDILSITTSGNVGIGITSAQQKLAVKGSIGIHGDDSSVGDFELYKGVITNNTNKEGFMGLYRILGGSSTPWINTIVGKNGLFLAASGINNAGIFISTDGSVGIGTNTPTCGSGDYCRLHVNGDSYFASDTSVMNGNMGVGYDVGDGNGSGSLYVLNSLGIGINNISDLNIKLQIKGSVQILQGDEGYVGVGEYCYTPGEIRLSYQGSNTFLIVCLEDGTSNRNKWQKIITSTVL